MSRKSRHRLERQKRGEGSPRNSSSVERSARLAQVIEQARQRREGRKAKSPDTG
jgi:hypothetical protein